MLVGSEIPAGLNRMLSEANAKVRHVSDGQAAIACAQHEMFDAVLLISTGDEMDLAETVLNLSDINQSMELIIVSAQPLSRDSAVPADTLVELLPNAIVMGLRDLKKHLTAS